MDIEFDIEIVLYAIELESSFGYLVFDCKSDVWNWIWISNRMDFEFEYQFESSFDHEFKFQFKVEFLFDFGSFFRSCYRCDFEFDFELRL